MNPDVCFNPQIVNNGSSCISPRISDQSSSIHSNSLHILIMITAEITEQHGNFI